LYDYTYDYNLFPLLRCPVETGATPEAAMHELKRVGQFLILITIFRLPVRIFREVLENRNKHIKHYMFLLIGWPFYVLLNPIDTYWKRKAKEEWDIQKNNRNGSEMALFFKRD